MNAVFDLSMPTSWDELTDRHLLLVFTLLTRNGLTSPELKALCLMKWNNLSVIASLPDKRFLVKSPKQEVVLTARQIQQASTTLDFLDQIPPRPIRIKQIGKHRALPADFEKVPFQKYLFLENLFQGYLNTQSEELLLQMAQILYESDHVKPSPAHLIGVFYWMASLKQYFAEQFPNFYRPASSDNGNLLGSESANFYRKLTDTTNSMIRALTGGDITKEAAILQMDTWRALTELDAKAREAEELRNAAKKK